MPTVNLVKAQDGTFAVTVSGLDAADVQARAIARAHAGRFGPDPEAPEAQAAANRERDLWILRHAELAIRQHKDGLGLDVPAAKAEIDARAAAKPTVDAGAKLVVPPKPAPEPEPVEEAEAEAK